MRRKQRNIVKNPYSKDEARVAAFIAEKANIGGGDDPIGFILASHQMLAHERHELQLTLREIGNCLENVIKKEVERLMEKVHILTVTIRKETPGEYKSANKKRTSGVSSNSKKSSAVGK